MTNIGKSYKVLVFLRNGNNLVKCIFIINFILDNSLLKYNDMYLTSQLMVLELIG